MAIIKVSPPPGWEAIPNQFVADPRLSVDAVAVGLYLASKPARWKILPDAIQAEFSRRPGGPRGRDWWKRVSGELQTAGYLRKIPTRNAGKFGVDWEFCVFGLTPRSSTHEPNFGSGLASATGSDAPGSDAPGSDGPGSDGPGSDAPGSDTPDADAPGADAPGTDGAGADAADAGAADTGVAKTYNQYRSQSPPTHPARNVPHAPKPSVCGEAATILSAIAFPKGLQKRLQDELAALPADLQIEVAREFTGCVGSIHTPVAWMRSVCLETRRTGEFFPTRQCATSASNVSRFAGRTCEFDGCKKHAVTEMTNGWRCAKHIGR